MVEVMPSFIPILIAACSDSGEAYRTTVVTSIRAPTVVNETSPSDPGMSGLTSSLSSQKPSRAL